MTEQVYLLLGSNEGNRQQMLREAIAALAHKIASGAVITSSVYETAAWGIEDQPPFLNVAVALDTSASPELLLQTIRDIELQHGRQRTLIWGQRTLDIDILLYGNKIIRTQELTVPHPRLQDRRFALVPLAEIAADVVHPILNRSVETLLATCADPLQVTIFPG